MRLRDFVVNGSLAALLFAGSSQTASSQLRPTQELPTHSVRGVRAIPAFSRPLRSPVRAQIDRLLHRRTDDAGSKITLREFGDDSGTSSALASDWPSPSQHLTDNSESGISQKGMPAHFHAVWWINEATGLSEEKAAELLGVRRLTVRNWKAGQPIKVDNLRHVQEVADVLMRAQKLYPEKENLVAWLYRPDPIDGIAPFKLLQQGEYDRARFLAVATPTNVGAPPAWIKKSVAEEWKSALEVPERPAEFGED